MQVKLAPGSKLFATHYHTPYEAIIVPARVGYGEPFYGLNTQNRQWYTLHSNDLPADSDKVTAISYEDPHGRINHPQGRIDIIGGNTLVMSRPAEYGGDWALYELGVSCPDQIDANRLPVDVPRIAFLGYTADGSKRLTVIISRFYPEIDPRVYVGSSFEDVLPSTEEVEEDYELNTEGALYRLKGGGKMLITLNTGKPCLYKDNEYYPVDSAAYTVEETSSGALLRRKQ